MTIAIIPARGGSRRIPRKNIREFLGKPIILYSIDTARASGVFDRIVVSTEDPEIARIAVDAGCDVHQRSFEDALDEVGTQAVMRAALGALGVKGGHAACIYATAPLLLPEDICRASRVKNDYCVAVGARPLRDAGAFYWGRVVLFRTGAPLYETETRLLVLPEDRVCDINTEEDWLRAEQMYGALNHEAR